MSSKIKLAIGVLLVVLLVVVAVSLLTGGDDDKSTSAGSEQRDGDSDSEPRLRTVAVERGEGTNPTAAAGANIEKPKEIWLRVSAAPKQEVRGQWNVSCGGGAVDMDTFTVTPPNLQQLRVPRKNAESCIAGASAQLRGKGRLKVAILRDR